MFQSDDFDDVLSDESFLKIDNDIFKSNQNFDMTVRSENIHNQKKPTKSEKDELTILQQSHQIHFPNTSKEVALSELPSNSNVNRRKRKFPGPAGLLDDANQDKFNCNIIQSSQNYSSQPQVPSTVFEEGPWLLMKSDLKKFSHHNRNLSCYTMAYVREQALAHRLADHKVPLLAGVIQSLDHTLQDPSIVLRDSTAEIQCTLHRDAWEMFGCYLVPQYSVMLLKNSTVLTTGAPLKKHYLNITINNIVSVYCEEENSYANNDLSKTPKNDIEMDCKTFSSESVLWRSNKVIVLRNLYNGDFLKTHLK